MAFRDFFKKAEPKQTPITEPEKTESNPIIDLLKRIQNDVENISNMNLDDDQKKYFLYHLKEIADCVSGEALKTFDPTMIPIVLETYDEQRKHLMSDAKRYEDTNNKRDQLNLPKIDLDNLDDFINQINSEFGSSQKK